MEKPKKERKERKKKVRDVPIATIKMVSIGSNCTNYVYLKKM